MKQRTKISISIGIVLAIVNLLMLNYNSYRYLNIPQWFEIEEGWVMAIFYGLIFLFFSHFYLIITIITGMKKVKGKSLQIYLLLAVGAISFISILAHWGALTDITKEYPAGLEIQHEIKSVWLAQVFHYLFLITSLLFFIHLNKQLKQDTENQSVSEHLFMSLNFVGVACGAVGIFVVALEFYFNNNPQARKWTIIPYVSVVVLPYLIMLLYWLANFISSKKNGWFDEKQISDINKSGITALLITVVFMILLFAFNYNMLDRAVSILWFPSFLFVVMLAFSVSNIFNFKFN